MGMTRDKLIQVIQDHSSRTGLAPATITGRAVGNSRLYQRLIFGGDCTTAIAERVVSFINAETQEGAAP